MSTRSEIKDGAQFGILHRGLVYTEALGWLDMGHARGNDMAALKRQFVEGERSSKPSYSVMYRQDMGVLKFKSRLGIGKFSHWEIKRGRSTEDINRIMLAMMMNTASRFEGLQSLRHSRGIRTAALAVRIWSPTCSGSIGQLFLAGTATVSNP